MLVYFQTTESKSIQVVIKWWQSKGTRWKLNLTIFVTWKQLESKEIATIGSIGRQSSVTTLNSSLLMEQDENWKHFFFQHLLRRQQFIWKYTVKQKSCTRTQLVSLSIEALASIYNCIAGHFLFSEVICAPKIQTWS